MICTPHRIVFGNQIEEEKVGGICDTQGDRRNTPKVSLGNLKGRERERERELMENMDADGNIKMDLKRNMKTEHGLDLSGSTGTSGGLL